MRLTDFIEQNKEQILATWEEFARKAMPAANVEDLRNSASRLLDAVVADMRAPQSDEATFAKSQGSYLSRRIEEISEAHAAHRVDMGFTLNQVASEFRALRASVVHLWEESLPYESDDSDRRDLIRFNEAIDQALIESINRYSQRVGRTRDLFLGMLGHDLRNPLSAITVAAMMLLRSENLDERQHRSAARIVNGAERMNRLIGDLLDFARSHLGAGIPIQPQPVDLARVARQVTTEIEGAHPERELRLEADGDLQGEWDGERLAQALGNLISNAFQHGSPKTAVTVRVHGEAEGVVLSVHNMGLAIEESKRESIFEPMSGQQSEDGLQTPTSGVGLGLYIVSAIARAHGGEVEVTSTTKSGTTFSMRLPRHAPAA